MNCLQKRKYFISQSENKDYDGRLLWVLLQFSYL